MGKYFGTDGFRGEAGVSLTADHAFKIGRFLGWYYNELRRRAGETAAARIVMARIPDVPAICLSIHWLEDWWRPERMLIFST